MTTCPRCCAVASLTSPGYGSDDPPQFCCSSCDVYGYRFRVDTPEAFAESDADRATSRANAAARRVAREVLP